MLPKNVYEHIRYGNGAKPGASLTLPNGTSYSVTREIKSVPSWTGPTTYHQEIVATMYPANSLTNRRVKSVKVRLGDIPTRPELEWKVYWTHEC